MSNDNAIQAAALELSRLPNMQEFTERLYAEKDERKLDTLIGEAACFLELYARNVPILLSAIDHRKGEDQMDLETARDRTWP